MGSEYDRKFEEMKKYIPFLENMIKRLESNTSSSNPRQAQLDKIRSLRDLLLDKKKRMKMDNLLKCEQVLVNLYAKVEQRDTLPAVKVENMDSRATDSSDLEAVRNKLNSVVKLQNLTETLPEIARASQIEEICEPGSKEPALFQRRPNRSSSSPTKLSPRKANETKISPLQSQRYTRVLVSPEPRSSRWPVDEDSSIEAQLFSRRSPRRSPRRNSPSYHKKEKKKYLKSKEGKPRKDLNITLKVPEESLHSLNTDDILSRIITCSDGDVDIDTLREVRSKILGELKQTGTNDDISEMILKSYNKKPKSKRKNRLEVEEGEISDSESEAIENIYGSLVVMDKDKKQSQVKTAEKNNQQRKIQICLVINADKEGESKTEMDLSESGVFEENKDVICIDSDASLSPNKKRDIDIERNQSHQNYDDALSKDGKHVASMAISSEKIELNKSAADVEGENKNNSARLNKSEDISNKQSSESPNVVTFNLPVKNESPKKSLTNPIKILYSPSQTFDSQSPVELQSDSKSSEPQKNIANFYNSQPENVDNTQPSINRSQPSHTSEKSNTSFTPPTREQDFKENKTDDSPEIPLLNEPTLPPKAKKDVMSEIDILQALKNDILSEKIPITATEADTPALHQPKITKVASATEAGALQPKITKVGSSGGITKKRISIENYKKKSENVAKSLFVKKRSNAARKQMKKQSLKLTEKECERFNFPARLSLDDDTDDISDDDLLDDDNSLPLDDIYGDLAPKSPDQDNFSDDVDEAPVLIPTEPVKTANVTSTLDNIDIRILPNSPQPVPAPLPSPVGFANVVVPTLNIDMSTSTPVFEQNKTVPDVNRKALVDPRLRRDLSYPANKDSPNPYKITNFEGTPRPTQFPNIPSLLGLNMTPVFAPSYAPSMTPIRTPNARSYEMTPTHQSFEIEEPQQKHVYAPSFSMCDNRERDCLVAKERPIWEPNKSANSNDYRSRRDNRNTRWESPRISSSQRDSQQNFNPRNDKFHMDRRDIYSKPDSPSNVGPWTDGPGTPGTSFGLLETPMTPSHPFGRSECPSTPIHPFGRSECPSTPIHSFGRSDCPTTPIHPFGRSDCPTTPSHPFGRSECPPTSSHTFGRSECPPTPNHPFGRSDTKDPRLNRRQSDYESRIQHDERERCYQNNRSNSYKSNNRPYGESDSPRNYDREQHVGRNDRYSNEQGSRYTQSSDPPRHFERERSIGRTDKNHTNESSRCGFDRTRRDPSLNRSVPREDSNRLFTRNRDNRYDSRYSDNYEEIGSRRNKRDRSIGRAMPGEPIRTSSSTTSVIKPEYNSLSVKPKADHSFTIDTSVNATFQNLIESGKGIQVFDYTFDSRRQRASSVGRSLVRESSVGRTLSHEHKPREAQLTDSTCFQRRKKIQRASSVGRDLVSGRNEKSLQEIKADFESFKLNSSKDEDKSLKNYNITKDTSEKNMNAKKNTSESNFRSRKEDFENQSRSAKNNVKQQYSPRKNDRDPRMRKDQKDIKNKSDRGSSNSWDRRHSGIDYSNDNIAKGTIMGTGFGVKNYKIPKIKRPEPERPKTPIKDLIKESENVKNCTSLNDSGIKIKSSNKKNEKNSDDEECGKAKVSTSKTQFGNTLSVEKSNDKKDKITDDGFKNKNKESKQKGSKKAIISDDESEIRVTRSSKKMYLEEPMKKTKRNRKVIIDDSDSDVETDMKTKNENIKMKSKLILSKEPEMCTKSKICEISTKLKGIDDSKESIKPILNIESEKTVQQTNETEGGVSTAEKELRNTLEEDRLDSSFGVDDLEIFSDNMVSDPVIDNINELIADLDNDLGASKSGNDGFTTEMEKIMGDMDSHEENTLGDISELIEKDLSGSNDALKQTLNDHNLLSNEIKQAAGPKNKATPIATTVKEQDPQSIIKLTSNEGHPLMVSEQPRVLLNKINLEKNAYNIETSTANNDEMVSTTQIESCSDSKKDDIRTETKTGLTIVVNDQSTPDSTIAPSDDMLNKPEESFPDSTMEIHSEISSDVTSTLNDAEKKETTKPSSSRKEAIESFGSLLTILQDKSKIKELLLMLGEQSGESEKIKKKLEKLSEIVSDEEDNNDQMKEPTKITAETTSVRQSNEQITTESIELQKVEDKNENLKQRASNEIEESVNKLDTCKTNKELVKDDVKDTQPENKKVECLQVPILDENTILKRAEKPTDSHTIDDLNDELESNENQDENEKTTSKRGKVTRRGRGRGRRFRANTKRVNKVNDVKVKELKPKIKKKKNRELQKLQNDIKEMYMCNDVLNATGIRMCRLAKMVDKKRENISPLKDEPMVLLEKCKGIEKFDEPVKKIRKKPGPKPKLKIVNDPTTDKDKSVEREEKTDKPKSYKPGPKSRTKLKPEAMDPYEFETDSVADTNTTKESDVASSDSESDSLASSCSSGSNEVLADIKKKPKKKRCTWQSGIIKPRYKKKKGQDSTSQVVTKRLLPLKPVTIPDMNCFTDKLYCFQRGVFTYDCRLCHYSGTEIVSHYKKQHAHTEVPLSRMDPDTAKKAIQQCEEVNFRAISKIPSEKYTCRFCYKEFSKTRVALETFFWHVVSTHTGEYKHLCYECINVTRCPFNLDIPPPPKEIKGQLIGYICGKCNFTQISLENLKTHVIVRHNDEQTEVYTINLGAMSQKAMKALLRKGDAEEQKPRMLRSSRSIQSAAETSDDRSEITGSDMFSEVGSAVPKIEEPDSDMDAALVEIKRRTKPGPIKSKLRFETEERSDDTSVKCEEMEHDNEYQNETLQLDDTYNDTAPINETHNESSELDQTDSETVHLGETFNDSSMFDHTYNSYNVDSTLEHGTDMEPNASVVLEPRGTTDVFEQPHFKLNFKETGAKEYVCCVKGMENHYKTTLLISLKKHVQTKHSENWDGYCCVCKVIVTLQGVQCSFKDCLTHFLDKHMDDFPVMEKVVENTNEDSRSSLRSTNDASSIERTESPRSYIAVRPLSDLISKNVDDVDPPQCEESEIPFPVIENVVSLGNKTVEIPKVSPVYPTTSSEVLLQPQKPFQYEEVQAEVMSKKHRIVLDTMMPKEMLVRVFKCAGYFCSFTSDSAENALVHASAHKQMGGEGALDCAYCNFDAAGNAIDLVMHVFKEHGRCQYACMLCFYRAAADQLVGAHFSNAHGATGKAAKVLRAANVVAPAAADTSNMLSRDTAVPYYICNHGNGSCKFRTFIQLKFNEHLQQKHSSEESHPCYLCEVKTPTPTELVKHMKIHGVKLYQCTWCVHGANTESEMLSHAASLHPTKNAQAYLRIITNKEGSAELRVLPLIYLNKLKVSIEDVTPSKVKENPTKEAERSIELEKLIRHTTLMLETESVSTSNPIPETPEVTEASAEIITESGDLTDAQTVEAIETSLLSSPVKTPRNIVEPATSTVKDAPGDDKLSLNQRTDHVVYCLDSDEEEVVAVVKSVAVDDSAKETVIDLSDDEPVADKLEQDTVVSRQAIPEPASNQMVNTAKSDKPKFKKLALEILFKCPSCEQNFKNVGSFKRHTNTCCLELSTIHCPHAPCPIVLSNITQLINHYNKDHNVMNIAKQYYCGVCKSRWSTLNVTKKHLKEAHNVLKVVITSRLGEDGICAFTVDKEIRAPPTREIPKRKASIETIKKFGIEDINKLPINPIMDSLVYCNICEFSTKVRLNMVRHLQLHAERQPVPQTAPVNPVPHLETNEKHFDKMVNLASSSAVTRAEKPSSVAPEVASRYPKYVPDRQRHTCGAKGCSYISVDEAMLRCHWDTLHSGAVDYHCVHCPPHQHLDTSKMLTASRIIAHLKMHDANLYACSSCTYYHYRKQIVEKHLSEGHKDKGGQVQVVREEGAIANSAPQTPGVGAIGTMDLKPWQCGLCSFKSMLRQSVVEHCSKQHQTKMQYKCAYCPFRTSAIENIVKHQSNAHPAKAEDVFYYYYREGIVPDEADGTPRWQKQRQKCGIRDMEVKTEPEPDTSSTQPLPKTVPIDLNLVKKEVDENKDTEMSIEDLCEQYGQFCEPNGISFKCPLCKSVSEYTRDDMQSHLYEELKYRRWSCAICPYKAFHRTGLNEHMASEHSRNFIEPSELPPNANIEKWVSKLLDHQSGIIDKNKINPKQNLAVEKPIAGPSKVLEPPKPVQLSSDSELEQAFGAMGTPKDDSYCCPKCKISLKDEDEMRNHLESELTKIRWCCTKCTDKFSTFHEAQFHCKSHPGPLSRPKEAIREPSQRSAWIAAVINAQKKSMKPCSEEHVPENIVLADTSDNSLLVVRYEEAAPTDEQLREIAREDQLREIDLKRPAELDSDDEESLVIYEPESKKFNNRNCPFCDFVSKSNNQYRLCMREHILRHYNLKVLTCSYCSFNSHRKCMYNHLQTEHPGMPQHWKRTAIPSVLPSEFNLKLRKNEKKTDRKSEEELPKKVCLHCEASVTVDEMITHLHGNKPSEFGDKGEVVVKCCICLTLRHNLESMQAHYKEAHPDITNLNYAYYKLQIDTRVVQSCGICNRRFTFIRDLRIHHSAMHGTFNLSYKTVPYRPDEDDQDRGKRKLEVTNPPPAKRIAKKSTTKLPNTSSIAKKSTTKLPLLVDSDSESEYTYYGSKPATFDNYQNVKTIMPMYNTMVQIDVKKLSGILKIDPKVVVKDCKK